MVNGEKAFGVIRVFLVFSWHISGQEVQSLVSAVSRHLLAYNHFQQGKENILQILTGVCQSSDKSKTMWDFNSIALSNVQSSVMLLWIHICSDVFSYRVQGPPLCRNFSCLLQTESHRHTGTCLQWPERSLHYLQPWCCTVCLFPPCEWWQLPLKHKDIINKHF